MNASSQADRHRCRVCGASLDRNPASELCPGCALESALEPQAAPDTALLVANSSGKNPAPTPPSPLGQFGDYELLEEIARGGMGVVFKARQASLDRLVAIKMLLFGPLASAEAVQRLRTEAVAAASLQHPNIVAIHEVGFREGQHFIAMDYVAGRSLAEIVRDGPLPARCAAGHLKAIAEAVHYAHECGILHRDLKPSNVLIDANDQPKVTDFGLAKRLEKETELTLSGQVLGSPAYMPPEQAAGRRGHVGRRSDVYSLGAILYHLLTGRAPFVALTVAETLQQVQMTEPLSPTVLNPHLSHDLKTICLKCLEKEPARRYQTAQELAEDLARFLNGEPIQARPVGRSEKVWRWCRRNPVVASLAAAAVLSFLLGFAGVTWQGQRASEAAADAQRQRDVAQGQRDVAQGGRYAGQMKLAQAEYLAGKVGGALKLLQAQIPSPGQSDFRGFEWRYLYRLCSTSPGEIIATNASGFQSVDFSPDGRMVAFGTSDGHVELFDAQRRQRVKRWQAHAGAVDDLAFHPRHTNWLAAASGDDGLLKLWEIASGRVLCSTNGAKGMWVDFAFSPTGRFLTARTTDGQTLNLWELDADPPGTPPSLTLRTNLRFWGPAAFSPDERTVAVCNKLEAPFCSALLDLPSGRVTELPLAHTDLITCVAFSPDGSKLVTGGGDERVVLWDVAQHAPLWSTNTDLIMPTAVVFSPNGQRLFASGWNQNIWVWELDKPTEPLTLPGHSAGVNGLALKPDGLWLATAGRDGTARVWPLPKEGIGSGPRPVQEFDTLVRSEDTVSPERGQMAVLAAAVAPDQEKVAAVTQEALMVLDLATGDELARTSATNVFASPRTEFITVRFSPDGLHLAAGSADGRVAVLEARTLQSLAKPMMLHSNQVWDIAYGLGGTILVTGGGYGTGVKLTEVGSGRLVKEIRGMEGSFPPQPLAVSSNGTLLATGSPEQNVCVWDLASGQLVARSPRKARFLHAVAFAPDGQWLAYADELGVIFLWEFRQQRRVRELAGHAGPPNMLAFSPDGRTLASAGTDHTIRLWHPQVDQEVAILKGHTDWVWCVAFAEHGDALLSGSRDGTLRLWRALPAEQMAAAPQNAAARHR